MDFKKARELLDLQNNFSLQELKKNYHMKALKTHPDKCTDDPLASDKFKEINNAYEYLLTYLSINKNYNKNFDENSDNNPDNNNPDNNNPDNNNPHNNINENFNNKNTNDQNDSESYNDLLFKFLKIDHKTIHDLIQKISEGYHQITVNMFEKMDKDNAIKLYSFVVKYKDILHITDDEIIKIKTIIREKIKNDNVYILNPSIEDLFNHKIFKLKHKDDIFYVPLWHSELQFSSKDNDINVLCVPELPDNISVDQNNNIHMNINISLQGILEKETIDVYICDLEIEDKKIQKIVKIKVPELRIQKYQTIILREQGIAIINMDDSYNIDKLSDVYLHINLF